MHSKRGFADFDVTETPEPGSLILLASGILTLAGRYVRRTGNLQV